MPQKHFFFSVIIINICSKTEDNKEEDNLHENKQKVCHVRNKK